MTVKQIDRWKAAADRLIFDEPEKVVAWVAERIPEAQNGFQEPTAIGVRSADGKRIIAGVVYSDYHPGARTMQLHFAADNQMWAKKEIILSLLAYPFLQLDVFKCWVAINTENSRSLKTTHHIGFKDEAVLLHQFGPGKHCFLKYMIKPDFMDMLQQHREKL